MVLVFELCNLILQALHLDVRRLLHSLHLGQVLLQNLVFIIELLDMLRLLDDALGLSNGFCKTEIKKCYHKTEKMTQWESKELS